MKCAVSVIIPVYNYGSYLKDCLDSVLGQTYEDIEVLCVDDGSTDGSGALLDDYARRDCRIKVVHKANEGAAKARNIGLSRASAPFVVFLDADDLLPSNYLSAHMEKRGGDDAAVTYAAVMLVNESAHSEILRCSSQRDYDSAATMMYQIMLTGWCPAVHCWMWPSYLLRQDVGWREDIISNDDFEFSFRQLQRARKVLFVADTVAVYRQHAGGLSHPVFDDQYFHSILEAAISREKVALSVDESEEMRFAVAQRWYGLLFLKEVLGCGYARRVALQHLKRLGMPKCLYMQPGSLRDRILKVVGPRIMVYLLRMQIKVGLW